MNAKALAAAVAVLARNNPHTLRPDRALDVLDADQPFSRLYQDDAPDVVDEALRLAREAVPQARPDARPQSQKPQAPGRPQKAAAPPASAPYRFVHLQPRITLPEGEHGHDRPIEGGLCATIAVEWAAETPLLIGGAAAAGQGNAPIAPMRLPGGGSYVIPGASLRGMIRAVAEILSLGRLGASNLHLRFGIRDFDHPWYKAQDVSKVKELKAGWLTLRSEAGGERAFITPIEPGEWAHVYVEDMIEEKPFSGAVADRKAWLGLSLVGRGDRAGKYDTARKIRNGAPLFDRSTASHFESMRTEGDRQMARYVAEPGPRTRPGWLVFSGPLRSRDSVPNKKREYVFYDEAVPNAPVEIAPHLWDLFKRLHSKPSKNDPVADGSWADMRKVTQRPPLARLDDPVALEAQALHRRVPVFYVGDLNEQDGRFAFGLTRLFKIPHQRAVRGVLPGAAEGKSPHDPAHAFETVTEGGKQRVVGYRPDFVEMLFGHLEEPQDAFGRPLDVSIAPGAAARKGRVAFSFAHLKEKGSAVPSEAVRVVQMAPRASYGPFYLAGASGKGRDYSADADDRPRLAGRKRYLPRHVGTPAKAVIKEIAAMGQAQIEPLGASAGNVESRLHFLEPAGDRSEILFASEIRLHNVTPAELGAVLFALTHGGDPAKPCRHMIGRAKAFGAGQLRVNRARLAVVPNDGKAAALVRAPEADEIASDDGRTGFCPGGEGEIARNASHRPFMAAFARYVEAAHGIDDIAAHPTIREFLGSCTPQEGARAAAADSLAYMELPRFAKLRDADVAGGPAGRLLRTPERGLARTWDEAKLR